MITLCPFNTILKVYGCIRSDVYSLPSTKSTNKKTNQFRFTLVVENEIFLTNSLYELFQQKKILIFYRFIRV